MREYKL